jgi:hypothetical protein
VPLNGGGAAGGQASQAAAVLEKVEAYWTWAQAQPRVAGFIPWHTNALSEVGFRAYFTHLTRVGGGDSDAHGDNNGTARSRDGDGDDSGGGAY